MSVLFSFAYDGDGGRAKKDVAGSATFYIGNHYEVSTPPTTTTKYYYFGAQRVAMQNAQGVTYLHGDHLGSTSATSGATSSTQVYYPFGGVRTASGNLQTDFTFTGQKSCPEPVEWSTRANLTTPPSRARAQSARRSPPFAAQFDPNCILA